MDLSGKPASVEDITVAFPNRSVISRPVGRSDATQCKNEISDLYIAGRTDQ